MVRGSTRLRLEPDLVTAAGPGTARTRALQPPAGNACPLTPARFRLIPFRSPLLRESRLISFPRGTEMCQFPRLPSMRLCIQRMDDAALPAPGFPIRRSAGQRLFSASPRLIAAVHVLLRLLVPRHPPCALNILTVSSDRTLERGRRYTPPRPKARTVQITLLAFVQFSSSAEAAERRTSARGLSKLSSDRVAPTPRSRPGRHLGHVRSTLGLSP